MVQILNWYLTFFKDCIDAIFGMVSIDGYSLGYMILGATLVGVVIAASIGMVGLFSHAVSIHNAQPGPDGGDHNPQLRLPGPRR